MKCKGHIIGNDCNMLEVLVIFIYLYIYIFIYLYIYIYIFIINYFEKITLRSCNINLSFNDISLQKSLNATP